MSIINKIVSAILFVSLLALAGCPGLAQQGGGSSQSSEPSSSGD
jgi:hypothetical protein